jgi:hypothetical protein
VFCSLDRVDIVAQRDGVRVFMQTDHRTEEEMQATLPLSVLFALVRMLLPRRLVDEGEPTPEVRYCASSTAPTAVREAVAAAGGVFETSTGNESIVLPFDEEVTAARDLLDGAMRDLAHEVMLRESLALSPQGLAEFEERVRAMDLDFEDDEHQLQAWTAAVELAAFTGELLRRTVEGRWVITDDALSSDGALQASDFGLLPFCFESEQGLTNAANKAMRAMTEPGQSVLHLLHTAQPQPADSKTVAILKPAQWGMEGVVARPLVEIEGAPLVVIAEDRPDTVAYSVADDKSPEEIEALFDKGLAAIANVEVQLEKIDASGMDVVVIYGDYYAAEKILDRTFMRKLHRMFDAPLLAVAIPVRGRMYVTSGVQPPENLARMIGLAAGVHGEDPNPITPMVFGVHEGEVQAVIRPDD